jgi:hypothetical protein
MLIFQKQEICKVGRGSCERTEFECFWVFINQLLTDLKNANFLILSHLRVVHLRLKLSWMQSEK